MNPPENDKLFRRREIISMKGPLLLLSQGRSGSTTLLRIMNTIDGVHLFGENAGMIKNLCEFYINLKWTNETKGWAELPKKPSWHNSFDFEEIKNSLYDMIKKILKSDQFRVWGFKEIRYGDGRYTFDEDRKCLDAFKELYPDARYIFLYREDIENQKTSGWWKDVDETEAHRILSEQKRFFIEYHRQHRDFSYLITMNDMLTIDENFLGMFKFLEEEYNLDQIKHILENELKD